MCDSNNPHKTLKYLREELSQPGSVLGGALGVEAPLRLKGSVRDKELDGVLHTVVPAPRHLHHGLPCTPVALCYQMCCAKSRVMHAT